MSPHLQSPAKSSPPRKFTIAGWPSQSSYALGALYLPPECPCGAAQGSLADSTAAQLRLQQRLEAEGARLSAEGAALRDKERAAEAAASKAAAAQDDAGRRVQEMEAQRSREAAKVRLRQCHGISTHSAASWRPFKRILTRCKADARCRNVPTAPHGRELMASRAQSVGSHCLAST